MVEQGILVALDDGYLVTEDGECWLRELGVACAALKKHERIFAPRHIDWSERRHHVAGALGAAPARRLVELGWVRRLPTSRAVCLTDEGRRELLKVLGMRL
jgi:hypothetical protein